MPRVLHIRKDQRHQGVEVQLRDVAIEAQLRDEGVEQLATLLRRHSGPDTRLEAPPRRLMAARDKALVGLMPVPGEQGRVPLNQNLLAKSSHSASVRAPTLTKSLKTADRTARRPAVDWAKPNQRAEPSAVGAQGRELEPGLEPD